MTLDLENELVRLPLVSDFSFAARDLPRNGIYFFYEQGEGERIVRVGTHKGNARLYDRIRSHYGTRRSHRAWRRTSVFRYHLGAALLNRDQDPQIAEWLDRKGERMREVEAEATELLHSTFTFRVLSVDDLEERLALERAMIGALSATPTMSEEWLGLYAINPAIRKSGLWNVDHIGATDSLDFSRLSDLIEQTLELEHVTKSSDECEASEPDEDDAG
ncbi:hypothetical protein BH09CHL1_BH09CHL1_15860 [soil metagenome]